MQVEDLTLNERSMQRIEELKSALRRPYRLCTERLQLITESFSMTEGEPMILRLAKAFDYLVEKMTIFINPGELIVGNGASRHMGVEIEPFFGPLSEEDIKFLAEENILQVGEEDLYVIRDLERYWRHRNLQHRISLYLSDDRLWPFAQTGVLLPPITDKQKGIGGWAQAGIGMGVNRWIGIVSYRDVLEQGLSQIIQKIEKRLEMLRHWGSRETIKRFTFWEAARISLKAIIKLANRFAELASKMAESEKDGHRKKELERIAEACRWVPANPPRNFYEALQSFWFVFLVTQQATASAGRFDQYMYKYYKNDIEMGNLSPQEALELLMLLRLKDMELVSIPLQPIKRRQYAGFAKWHNFTIGGVTPDGRDATNELTYLLLEAARRTLTPHHTLTLRVHERTPEELLIKALEVVKTGIGMPAFIGDKSYIEWLLSRGVPLEYARDYAVAGCIEPSLEGRSRQAKCTFFVPAKVLEIFLNKGRDPRTGLQVGPHVELEKLRSFDEFMSAYKEYLEFFVGLAAELINVDIACSAEFASPIDAALISDDIDEGKTHMDRPMLYENIAAISLCGMINAADSLVAIKKLVFEDRICTLEDIVEAINRNWEGFEWLHKLCLDAPKYGNDDDYADLLVKELYDFFSACVSKQSTVFGTPFIPAAISITSQWAGGSITGATPDGRHAGEVLADGGASPMRGRDRVGLTAVIKSAAKIDQVKYQSVLLNLKLHPSTLRTRDDLKKLATLIKAYFDLGGKHVQFNVVDRETLLRAQRFPEDYKDLVVRVAGFSAYFVELSKPVQDEIIARTEIRF